MMLNILSFFKLGKCSEFLPLFIKQKSSSHSIEKQTTIENNKILKKKIMDVSWNLDQTKVLWVPFRIK